MKYRFIMGEGTILLRKSTTFKRKTNFINKCYAY